MCYVLLRNFPCVGEVRSAPSTYINICCDMRYHASLIISLGSQYLIVPRWRIYPFWRFVEENEFDMAAKVGTDLFNYRLKDISKSPHAAVHIYPLPFSFGSVAT